MKTALSVFFIVLIYSIISKQSVAQIKSDIGLPINHPQYVEYSPCISLDGRVFVFVSNREGSWKIYESILGTDNKWSEPQSIASINDYSKADTIGGLSLNHDATVLYFHANYAKQTDIYYSTRQNNNQWSAPQSVGEPINTSGYEGSPCISADDRFLYFVRTIPNTDATSRQIWITEKKDGQWQTPTLLPAPVNLVSEEYPYIAPDNQTLFFSSERELRNKDGKIISKGGYDLYYTRKLADNVWQTPISIDATNTEWDDCKVSIPASGDIMYFSSAKIEKKKAQGEIYTLKIPQEYTPQPTMTIRGKVSDLYNQTPVVGKIRITDPITDCLVAQYQCLNDGSFTFLLNQGKKYMIDVYQDSCSHAYTPIDLRTIRPNSVLLQNFKLFCRVNLTLNIFEKEYFEPLSAQIQIKDAATQQTMTCPTETLSQGRYKLQLPIGKKLIISIKKDNYKPQNITLDLSGIIQFSDYEQDIELKR